MDQVGFPRATGPRRSGGPPGRVPGVYLGQVAVHADEEDIQAVEQPGQALAPGAELDDEVVSRCGQCGQAPVEAIEEPRSHLLPPGERAVWIAPGRQHAAGHHMVG
jgi:hypothetical protein